MGEFDAPTERRSAVPKKYAWALDAQTVDDANRRAIESAKRAAAQFNGHMYVELTKADGTYGGHHMLPPTVPRKGLLLTGPTGTGKSTILGGVMLAAESRNTTCAWVHWDNLLKLLKAPERESGARLRTLREVQCLVLDELGQWPGPDYLVGSVSALIEDRYNAELPFLVATNTKTDDELRAAIGAPAVSRLLEVCERIPVLGDDRRRQKAAPETKGRRTA